MKKIIILITVLVSTLTVLFIMNPFEREPEHHEQFGGAERLAHRQAENTVRHFRENVGKDVTILEIEWRAMLADMHLSIENVPGAEEKMFVEDVFYFFTYTTDDDEVHHASVHYYFDGDDPEGPYYDFNELPDEEALLKANEEIDGYFADMEAQSADFEEFLLAELEKHQEEHGGTIAYDIEVIFDVVEDTFDEEDLARYLSS